MARARAVDVWIVNKSGGLIYRRAFEDAGGGGRGGLDTRCAVAVGERVALVARDLEKGGAGERWGGIESLECDTFDLYCFQADTGMKIFITTTKGVVGRRWALAARHQRDQRLRLR